MSASGVLNFLTTRSSRLSRVTAPRDIWPAAKLVLDAAATKHAKTIEWKEVLAGQKASTRTGDWVARQTVADFREHLIGIKGPLTHAIGRRLSARLNVALRSCSTSTCACARCVGSGGPVAGQAPRARRMVDLSREHEDVYAGLGVEAGSPGESLLFLKTPSVWNIREMSARRQADLGRRAQTMIRAAINMRWRTSASRSRS